MCCTPNCRKFWKQLLLYSWRPKPSIIYSIIVYFIFSIIMIPLGIAILLKSNEIWEFKQRYDNIEECQNIKKCKINFEIKEKIEGPVYVYYNIKGFYQNHRRFVVSIISDQIEGKEDADVEMCDNMTTNSEMGKKISITNKSLNKEDTAIPCGIAAKLFFNDNFTLNKIEGGNTKSILISNKNISWESDVERFKNINLDKQWIDMTNERFINWMRIAPFENFIKTWGVINEDLDKGSYTVDIDSVWDVDLFGGEKILKFSQVNSYGGKNMFLAVCLLVFGALSFLLGIFMFIFYLKKIRKRKKKDDNVISNEEITSLYQNDFAR